jgi:16S rRNA (uracil1498-N3)-methyltransferase
MTRRRWIADEASADRAWLTGAHADHLVRVLRAQPGQEFDIVANGLVRQGKILNVSAERVEFALGGEVAALVLPSVVLVLAIYKFDRMEWALEKCTELGVDRFVPVIARRTDAHLAASAEKRAERWRRIVRQAAEQSRRTAAPEVDAPVLLKQVLSLPGLRVVLAETEREISLRDAVRREGSLEGEEKRPLTLAIGPEGGWTEEELQSFANSDWVSASLGDTVLRAETAAIAATAIVFSTLQN